MNKTLSLFLVFMLVVFLASQSLVVGTYANVSISEAKQMIDASPDLVKLDVRTEEEYNDGHIANAILIPVNELESRLDELDKEKETLVYCGSGVRSATASQTLVDNGFINVYNMLGGITAWKDEGYSVYVKYSSIQAAINNANEGDTLFISSGIYYENVVVNKAVSLIGENRSNTVIDGGKVGKVVTITEISTLISGFTIQKAGFTPWESDSGIYLKSSNSIITNNIIINNEDWGIWIDSSSSNNTITHNNITDNWRGCMLKDASGNTLTGNDITDHGQEGICLWNSSNNVLSGNSLSGNVFGIEFFLGSNSNNVTGNNITNGLYGISLSSSSRNKLRHNILNNNLFGIEVDGVQDIDASNTVNGKPIYYWVNHHNEQVPPDAGYVALINCTNITVDNLDLTRNVEGIALVYTNNSLIQNLEVTNNECGVLLHRSCNNVIRDSNITNNQVGVNLESSFGNVVSYNNVTEANEGILLTYSSNNSVTNNNIAHNEVRGIFLGLSSENNIAYNTLMNNNRAGIEISSNGTGILEKNVVHHNNITNNSCGVRLGDTSGNKIYLNNFVNNTKQASVSVSVGSVSYGNVWDNGSTGNFWSDYEERYPNATEIDGSGIWDTPYAIDENNQDNYPRVLMEPWNPPQILGDVNGDGVVDIFDVVLVSIAFGSTPEAANWNQAADLNKDEIIDIFDVVLIAKNFGKTA